MDFDCSESYIANNYPILTSIKNLKLVNENNRKSFRESLQVEQTSIQQENEQQFETREQVNAYKEEQSQDGRPEVICRIWIFSLKWLISMT